MKREVVAKIHEIPPGGRKLITPWKGLAGIGVFDIDGQFYAMRNVCPHRFGPLCVGQVSGRVVAAGPPSVAHDALPFEQEGEVIRCPWHLWEFDIRTGQCLVDPRVRVKTYPVQIEGDNLMIECDEVTCPGP
jgi:nitrite reductase (NADH) small subunit